MTRAMVVINEQHSLMAEQMSILNNAFESVELLKVPANGWNLDEIKNKCNELANSFEDTRDFCVIFASPIPAMIKLLTQYLGYDSNNVYVFHNDKREKKELPGGKIIFTVSETGWELV